MSQPLMDTAPGFDQPIAVLKHCHDRIRKQLQTLEKLLPHLTAEGATVDAQQAAQAVLRYFNQAAPNHHADEEEDLFPMLQATAQGEDATLLQQVGPRILNDHREMEQLWAGLSQQLQAISNGSSSTLSTEAVQRFATLYLQHMEIEEGNVAPMAKRLFSSAQMQQLGEAMQRRRGITPGGQ